MENINQYMSVIDAAWHIRNKISQLTDVIKEFLGKELQIKYIFVSNWINDQKSNYEYGDSLWIFTECNLIECVDFDKCNDPYKCKFNVHELGAIQFSQITSLDYKDVMIDIQLPNSNIINFRAVNSNRSHLIKIYQDLLFKNTSL